MLILLPLLSFFLELVFLGLLFKLLEYIIIRLRYWFLRLNNSHCSMLGRFIRNKILKSWNLLLWHLRLIHKWSECTWKRHLRLIRYGWLDWHLFNITILTLCSSLHFLLKFVLFSVLFKLLFIKCFRQINWFFSLGFNRLRCFWFNFFFLDWLSFSRFSFGFLNYRWFFFFDRFLDFLFDFWLAYNWLSGLSDFGLLLAKESTPIISRCLLWLNRLLWE